MVLENMSAETQPQQPVSFRESYAKEVLQRPENKSIGQWYTEQLESFGEMTVEKAPLTDGDKWKAEATPEGEVEQVDGAFFTLEGAKVIKYNADGSVGFSWTQPATIQKESEVTLPINRQEVKVKMSGLVGAVQFEGHTLVTLAQEPLAHTPKKVLARTPFQTSAAKLQSMIEGKREVDPQLYDLITSLSPGKNVLEIFQMGLFDVFPLPYADANRIDATNLGFTLQVSDPALVETLKYGGKSRWCSPQEVKALARVGLLNGHTAAVALASS